MLAGCSPDPRNHRRIACLGITHEDMRLAGHTRIVAAQPRTIRRWNIDPIAASRRLAVGEGAYGVPIIVGEAEGGDSLGPGPCVRSKARRAHARAGKPCCEAGDRVSNLKPRHLMEVLREIFG